MNKLAGRKLSDARERKGITQGGMADMLAERLGQTYSLRQYQKLEFGHFPKFKKEIVQEIDKILSTDLYELIYEQKPSPNGVEKLASPKMQPAIETFIMGIANKIERISVNSDETNALVKAILTSQIGYSEAIGNTLDRVAKLQEGTTSAAAGTIEQRIWKMLKEKGIEAIVRK